MVVWSKEKGPAQDKAGMDLTNHTHKCLTQQVSLTPQEWKVLTLMGLIIPTIMSPKLDMFFPNRDKIVWVKWIPLQDKDHVFVASSAC